MDRKLDPKTEEEFKAKLTPEQYAVLREGSTERPGSGEYLHEKRKGVYMCAACGNPLFASDAKFESGTGWPSFDQALPGAVEYIEDNTNGMRRTEVVCANCKSHLGHMFPDGPQETTGERFCMNSVCLLLKPEGDNGAKGAEGIV
jgi:peptide-methionine (R)-S-oxide reductase